MILVCLASSMTPRRRNFLAALAQCTGGISLPVIVDKAVVVVLKVARLDFLRGIPPKFELIVFHRLQNRPDLIYNAETTANNGVTSDCPQIWPTGS